MKVIFRRYNTQIVWNQFRKIKITNFRAYKQTNYAREFIVYKIEIDNN